MNWQPRITDFGKNQYHEEEAQTQHANENFWLKYPDTGRSYYERGEECC